MFPNLNFLLSHDIAQFTIGQLSKIIISPFIFCDWVKIYWMLFCLPSIHHLDNINSLLGNYHFPIACYFHEIANKGVSSDFGQRWAHDLSQVNKTVEFDSWATWYKDQKVGLFIFMVKPWKGCSLLFEWRGLIFWTREPLIRSPEIGGQLRAQCREAIIVKLGGQWRELCGQISWDI